MDFSLMICGKLTKTMSVGQALRITSTSAGVCDIIPSSFTIDTKRVSHVNEDLKKSVKDSSEKSGFKLNDVQALAVCKITNPDTSDLTIRSMNNQKYYFKSPTSDISRPCILDMPTGSGKTITSLVSGIVFSICRNDDMGVPNTISESRNGCVQVFYKKRESNRKFLVFAPKHLVGHWVKHASIAKKIAENMYPEWKVSVYLNKRSESINPKEKEIAVIVYDHSHGPKKVMSPDDFYPSVCFDESGEGTANIMNQVFDGLRCGRMIMCSADVSHWRRFTPRKNSIFRDVFPSWTSYLGDSVETVASLSMSSVFKEEERGMVLSGAVTGLMNIPMYTSSIKYVPSLLERLGHGSAVDLGDVNGIQMFERRNELSISGCRTIGDICKVVEDKIASFIAAKKYLPQNLTLLVQRLKAISEEDCVICLEKMEEACVLQPCMHFTCRECVNKISFKCPICRCGLQGSIGIIPTMDLKRKIDQVDTDDEEEYIGSKRKSVPGVDVDKDLGKLYFEEIGKLCKIVPVPGGVVAALNHTLEAIKISHLRRGGGTLKVMLISPGVNVRQDAISSLGYEFSQHRTIGNKQDPARRVIMEKVLKKFADNDGNMKILSVRDSENTYGSYGYSGTIDNMVGLDIDGLDAVVSIGSGSRSQRMGRLCRMNRVTLKERNRSALYIELVSSI